MSTFEKALNELPDSAGFDPAFHHTIQDLCWICLHELDLVAEQENELPLVECKKLLRFIKKHGFYVTEAKAMYLQCLDVAV